MEFRNLTERERGLLVLLLDRASIEEEQVATDAGRLMVQDMNDGGMGSLRIRNPSGSDDIREPVRMLSELTFKDQDGVDVIASLYVDQKGSIVELDMWKTDFSALIAIPDFSS